MRFVQERYTAHLGISAHEIELQLEAVASHFGERWLKQHSGHPLQSLLQRKDALATNQLVTIGGALLSLAPSNQKWIRSHVNKIKGYDAGNRRGSMFELLGLHLLGGPGIKVTPTPANHQGYDGLVTFEDGMSLHLSLKNYGKSSHEENFSKCSERTEAAFIEIIRAGGWQGYTLFAEAKRYPSSSDWQALQQSLQSGVAKKIEGMSVAWEVSDCWNACVIDPPAAVLPLSDKRLSYNVVILAPFHANESQNLISKLEHAASDLRKHSQGLPPGSACGALICLPETLAQGVCEEWVQGYIDCNQQGPLDLILLYQLSVVENPGDQTVMNHYLNARSTARYAAWIQGRPTIRIVAPVGKASYVPSSRRLQVGEQTFLLDRTYSYQHGEYFTLAQITLDHGGAFTVQKIASGITRHAIVRMPDGFEQEIRSPFPPKDSISLFD